MTHVHETARRVRKLMLYSHDTYGLGHLRRNLGIARHLLESTDGLQIVLVSGSPVSDHFATPPGLTIVNLPSVHKVAHEQYRPSHPDVSIGLVRRARTAIMSDVARRLRPDVLLVDHSPAGMNGELLGVFETLREHSPSTRVILGLRDILDDPATVVRTWTEQGIYSVLAEEYDDVFVYGSRDVFDVGANYAIPRAVREGLRYCGYLARTRPADAPGDHAGPRVSDEPYVLVTAGGGGDGARVLAGAIEAGEALGVRTLAVTGPLIAEGEWSALEARAAHVPNVDLIRFHPRLRSAMASATTVVTMGGYNSLCEAISVGVPTVVVPRCHPRLEQTLRAQLFADRGLVELVAPGPDLGTRLATALVNARSRPRPSVGRLDLGGLDRLRGLLLGRGAARRRADTAARSDLDERHDLRVSA